MKLTGMAQKLMNNYKIVEPDEKADIYIVNTCSVTNIADRKSRQLLRRAKEINNKAIVIAVGCYADVAKEELEKIEEVDLVLTNNQKVDIEKYIRAYIEGVDVEENEIDNYFKDFGSITYTEKTRAVIKIQDGCNNFCSYCIIPYARGRICSRRPENIIKEVSEITNQGIKEVVITGIQIASYGKDFEEEYSLIDLLEEINKIKGIERIRLGSLEPRLITDDFCNRLIKLEKICHHFHLSLQSGCDKTLKQMNRKYTTAEFLEVIARLRKMYDDAMLTTDIIVGFPGETEQDFEETYQYLKKVNFYKMHVFKFSPRKGTVAAEMEDQISAKIKDERSKKLIELSDQNEKKYLEDYIGKQIDVLFEEREREYLKGHSGNYILVKSKQEDDKLNQICFVKVCKTQDNELYGE